MDQRGHAAHDGEAEDEDQGAEQQGARRVEERGHDALADGEAVGAQGSTIHANYLEKFYKDSDIRLYPTQEEANLDLLNGRLDYIVADALALADFLKGKGKDCCRKIAEVKRDDAIHGPGVAGAVRKSDTALKEMISKAIAETMADGSHKKLEDKWFKYD